MEAKEKQASNIQSRSATVIVMHATDNHSRATIDHRPSTIPHVEPHKVRVVLARRAS
jgi:hypothetical protein